MPLPITSSQCLYRCFLAKLIASAVPRGFEDSGFPDEGRGAALTLSAIESSGVGRGLPLGGYEVPWESSGVPTSQPSSSCGHILDEVGFLGVYFSNHTDGTLLVIEHLHFHDSALVGAPLRSQILLGSPANVQLGLLVP